VQPGRLLRADWLLLLLPARRIALGALALGMEFLGVCWVSACSRGVFGFRAGLGMTRRQRREEEF